MSGSVRLFATFLASAAICLAVASCQTGVDSTGRIELSRKERRLFRATEADTLLNAAAANDSLPAWKPGRPFLAVSDRTAYIFESASLGTADPISLHLGGKILTFGGMETKTAPDGTPHATIIFNDGDTRYVYDTGRTPAEARSLQPDRLPLLVDLTIVARADSILRGRKLWTLNPNRYTTDGVLLNESKFMPVTVDSVVAGNDGLPFKICFATPSGPRYVLAGLPPATAHTLTFPALFSLHDIRKDYPHIYQDVWENICAGIVARGMTKEECRLALGSPSEIDRGRDWSSLHERWTYPGGIVLMFDDGRLTDFRK